MSRRFRVGKKRTQLEQSSGRSNEQLSTGPIDPKIVIGSRLHFRLARRWVGTGQFAVKSDEIANNPPQSGHVGSNLCEVIYVSHAACRNAFLFSRVSRKKAPWACFFNSRYSFYQIPVWYKMLLPPECTTPMECVQKLTGLIRLNFFSVEMIACKRPPLQKKKSVSTRIPR